jgi:8-oxo-dGTP pyrophosphatase MutT (NUDIX family)
MEGPIHVVTCFLRRGDRILVLKRSMGVATNKGRWAGVSGYVEPGETPRETAYKEMEEEVSATAEQLELVREAPPLTLLDEEHDTTWVVHPFLFDDLGVGVKLDWEHTEFAWIDPIQLAALDTVGGLDKTLDAALGIERPSESLL